MILTKITEMLNRILTFLAGLILIFMVLLTCANIVFRLFWVPVSGTYELMGFSGALLTAFALAYTQVKKGHIAVDVLVNVFQSKTRWVLAAVNNGLCSAFFMLAAWQLTVKANTLRTTGEVTETLRIIYYPFTYMVALGCGVLALLLLTDLLKQLMPAKETES
ncbi:MAG: TRAP transporter small permease subunit [Deltaproteobacteria bacterium]|jgi:TRAP-type C4-dicarboxylate transport system permease small subunit|nr:TRAP transporter small permease subunit [Deltaproteobacteria bacterium]